MKEDEVRKLWLRKEEESRRKKVGRRLDELEVSLTVVDPMIVRISY